MSDLEARIRGALLRYTIGEMSLLQLKDWFIGILWEMKKASPVSPFANEIQGILAESSSADWTEPQIKDAISQLLNKPVGNATSYFKVVSTYVGQISVAGPKVSSGATIGPYRETPVSLRPVDTQPSVVYESLR